MPKDSTIDTGTLRRMIAALPENKGKAGKSFLRKFLDTEGAVYFLATIEALAGPCNNESKHKAGKHATIKRLLIGLEPEEKGLLRSIAVDPDTENLAHRNITRRRFAYTVLLSTGIGIEADRQMNQIKPNATEDQKNSPPSLVGVGLFSAGTLLHVAEFSDNLMFQRMESVAEQVNQLMADMKKSPQR